MNWRNLCLISLFLCSVILPIISTNTSAEIIVESIDAPETIPNPQANHNISAITINACDPVNCVLNNSNTNYQEINGEFIDSEDKDVYWIKSNSLNKQVSYELCINSSTVPVLINTYSRNQNENLIEELTEPLISEIPATNQICNNIIAIDETNEELWIKIKSLSTSGNYSIIVKSNQIGSVGQEFIENNTHISYKNKGINVNSSNENNCNNDLICINVLNHSIKQSQLWNLDVLSDFNHTIQLNCIMTDGEKINGCITFESQYKLNDLFLSYINYYSLKNVNEIEIILIFFKDYDNNRKPFSWEIIHSLNKNGDPFMDYGSDAPGNLTDFNCDIYKCNEFEANTGLKYVGNMPLSVFDEADTWILTIEGEEFETFLVEIGLLCDPGSIMLEIHSPNSDGTMNITYLVPTSSVLEKLQIEISPGTHYVKLINLRLGNILNWSYGDLNLPITNYEIQIKSIKNQTDNNTFFVSEELLFWDNILLWFMGFCFILPMIWVLFNIRKDSQRMELILHDRERLARLRSMKSTSTSEINEVKSDLSIFIRAITKLDWNILLETWGVPEISYVTKSISINSWKLDSAIANNNGIPLLIIIETHEADWEIAALKFESKNNIEWKVVSIQPNLLTRNHEVFLDTVKVGNKVILEVELKGKAKDIQMHISGMSEGKPVAVKTPNSMGIYEEE